MPFVQDLLLTAGTHSTATVPAKLLRSRILKGISDSCIPPVRRRGGLHGSTCGNRSPDIGGKTNVFGLADAAHPNTIRRRCSILLKRHSALRLAGHGVIIVRGTTPGCAGLHVGRTAAARPGGAARATVSGKHSPGGYDPARGLGTSPTICAGRTRDRA